MKNFSLSTIAGATLGLLLVGYTVLAWSVPTSPAPGGNMPSPLNTGISDQTKAGGTLTLQGDLVSKNTTIKGDDMVLGAGAGQGITTDGDLKVTNSSGQEKVGLHAGDIGNWFLKLFDSSGNSQIAFNPQDKKIQAGTVTINGDGTISPNLNANKLQDLQAADLMAAGGGVMSPADYYKYIYVYFSKNSHDGNLGGLTGANTICANEKTDGVPSGLTYKAYLCDTSACQKPIATTNTIVIGAPRGIGLGYYKIINILKTPDALSASTGSWDELKYGLSGIGSSSAPFASLGQFLVETSPITYWTGIGSPALFYTNVAPLGVYDLKMPSSYNCNSWTGANQDGYFGNGSEVFTAQNWVTTNSRQGCNVERFLLCFAQ
ncbi:MAG: hypothetical protein HYV65_02170 [Candidatus Spechtbacteria bacterium]|nr:hypothetical protein [Candidatus Spechtbacteria bacterium]